MNGLIDTHCHLLYGVDDGAKTLEDSRRLLLMEQEEHVSEIYFTPHYRERMFETDQRVIEERYFQLKQLVRQLGISMKLHLGCEYHWNSHMVEDLQSGRRPTMGGSRYVLTEFSTAHSYELVKRAVYQLIASGYQPIIAHIERYPQVVRSLQQVEELYELGAWIQLTASSVMGEDGRMLKKTCAGLLNQDLVHLIATDAHDTRKRVPRLNHCAAYVIKKYGRDCAKQIFIENPRKLQG